MIIYIRHAEKEYTNNSKCSRYRFDPGITEIGTVRSKLLCQQLVERYGLPEIIYYSPFLRCRQTLECFLEKLKDLKYDLDKIELRANCEVGEYLGNQMSLNLEEDVTADTRLHNTINHPETFKMFSTRVENHYQKFKDNTNKKIWIITHGIVMNKINQLVNNHKRNSHYDYLATLII